MFNAFPMEWGPVVALDAIEGGLDPGRAVRSKHGGEHLALIEKVESLRNGRLAGPVEVHGHCELAHRTT